MANPKTFKSDFERGRYAVIDDATAIIGEMKASTDGPKRDDWQLGYAAACREIAERLVTLKNN